MEVVKHKWTRYYFAKEVKTEHKYIFDGCKDLESIIKIRKLTNDDYRFVVMDDDNTFTTTHANHDDAVLLLRKLYVDLLIEEFKNNDNSSSELDDINNDTDSNKDSDWKDDYICKINDLTTQLSNKKHAIEVLTLKKIMK